MSEKYQVELRNSNFRHLVAVPGQLNFILRRNFVQYALHDQVAKQFKAWLRDGAIEKSLIYVFYLSSLNYSPMSGAPGAREPGDTRISKCLLGDLI